MQINPYSNEIRYTMSLMAYQLKAIRPGSVRIASHSVEMVKSLMRYLSGDCTSIMVESPEIQSAVAKALGTRVNIFEPGNHNADAALFPFSLEEGMQHFGEPAIVAACYNALSYKNLLYPRSVKGTIFQKLAALRSSYRLRPAAGLFSPRFIVWHTLAKLVERWDSAWHFQMEDRAMRQLIETGPLWRLSYIVVITGRNTG